MSSENEKRAGIWVRLLEVAWTNFDRRRSYEWKMSFAIWTAIAAFIALYLKGEFPKSIPSVAGDALILAACFIILVQVIFLVFIRFANGVDQKKAVFYEDLLNEATEACDSGFKGTKVESARKWISWTHGFWSIPCEVLITVILLLCAWSLVSGGTDPTK